MQQLNAYLIFDGTCAEAVHFYERTLGAKVEMLMTMGQSPVGDKMPPGSENRVMHARLTIGDSVLMASDSMQGQPYEGMKSFSLALTYPSVAEAERVFAALAEGGKITMPIAPSFWAETFGMLVDRYGTPWMINGPMKPFEQK